MFLNIIFFPPKYHNPLASSYKGETKILAFCTSIIFHKPTYNIVKMGHGSQVIDLINLLLLFFANSADTDYAAFHLDLHTIWQSTRLKVPGHQRLDVS